MALAFVLFRWRERYQLLQLESDFGLEKMPEIEEYISGSDVSIFWHFENGSAINADMYT